MMTSPGAAHATHWARPDIVGDLVAFASAAGAAPPREIHLRPELYARMLAQLPPGDRPAAVERGVGPPPGIPLVLDPELPAFPGFEVVRARPYRAAA
jgi:hypothetical protein